MVRHPTDLVAEAEKGGRFRRLLALREIDAVRAGYKQYVVRRQWILRKGPQKGTGRGTRQLGFAAQTQSSLKGGTAVKSRSMKLSFILLVGLLVAGTLLLVACGGGSTTTTTAPSTQTSTSQPVPGSTDTSGTTATSAAGTPKYGGTLRIAAPTIGANIGWPATMGASGILVTSYYETLFHSDAKGDLIPWLAESYKVADDQKSITFTIRKGVKFSDGSDLTAEVVKWNLEQYWG